MNIINYSHKIFENFVITTLVFRSTKYLGKPNWFFQLLHYEDLILTDQFDDGLVCQLIVFSGELQTDDECDGVLGGSCYSTHNSTNCLPRSPTKKAAKDQNCSTSEYSQS